MGDMKLWQVMVVALLVFVFLPGLAVQVPSPRAASHGETAVNRLVHDVCNKKIVLLGEDSSHGSGETLEVKTQIVERLVNQCGFEGVLFESSFYEFVHFQHLIDKGTATPKNLADSIGAIWTAAAESQPLVHYLYAKAMSKAIKIGGLDPQVGSSTAQYEAAQLANDLVKYLPPERRPPCKATLDRYDRWEYDDAHPLDAAAKKERLACIVSIRAALAKDHHKGRTAVEASAMAQSYEIDLKMINAAEHGSHEAWAMRDHAMFENLQWFLAKWPRDYKVIVWTATVHAIKHQAGSKMSFMPLGAYVHEMYGHRAAAIGFSALTGTYGRPGKSPSKVPMPVAGSLESSACNGTSRSPCYLDSQALRNLGRVPGHALSYSHPMTVSWAKLLDGVLVLPSEHPLTPKEGNRTSKQP